jgi:hypothetical protein
MGCGVKGQTKRHANAALDELTRRDGGRGHQLEHAPTQAVSSDSTTRNVPIHVIRRRRARNRMRRDTRKAQRR